MKPGKQRGVAAVELALILPVMLIAVFGITELGRALYQYNALVKASRDAVRYLAQQDLAHLSSQQLTAAYDTTKALAVCGAPVCPAPVSAPGCPAPVSPLALAPCLTTAKVSLCDYVTQACLATHRGVLTGQGTVDLVTVKIGGTGAEPFTFTSLMPYVVPTITFPEIKTTMASRYF